MEHIELLKDEIRTLKEKLKKYEIYNCFLQLQYCLQHLKKTVRFYYSLSIKL